VEKEETHNPIGLQPKEEFGYPKDSFGKAKDLCDNL